MCQLLAKRPLEGALYSAGCASACGAHTSCSRKGHQMSCDLSLRWQCLLMQGCHPVKYLPAQRALRRERATAPVAIPSLRWRPLRRACPTASAQRRTDLPWADFRAARRIARSSRLLSLCMNSNSISCWAEVCSPQNCNCSRQHSPPLSKHFQAVKAPRALHLTGVQHLIAHMRHQRTAGTMPHFPSFSAQLQQ